MNERIAKLAVQAGLSHMPSNYPDMADLYKGADFELEKFYELIVRECIERVRDQYVPLRDKTTPFENNPFPNLLTVRTEREDGIIECGVNSVVALEELIQEQIEKWYNENLAESDDE